MNTSLSSDPRLGYLKNSHLATWQNNVLVCPIDNITPAIKANSVYFGHPVWGRNYFESCHRDNAFAERWQAIIGSWQDKIVVDIGCGPGNLFAALGDRCGQPKLLLGVDVSAGALEMAQEIGYTTVLADAQKLPFVDCFADIVTINASLHHCDNMAQALAEAARIVRPGGLLIADQDPQFTSLNYNWLGKLLWNARLPLYLAIGRGGHTTAGEQYWAQSSEIHHKPGKGVSASMYYSTLEPLGFDVNIYPHNCSVGAKVLSGDDSRPFWKCYVAQKLSGIDTKSPEASMVLLCVARRSR
jgi:ubiquinone/menaquinone biosynthesis C-methylase UbiE